MGLWGICDDNYATFPNRPEWVKAQVFPYEEVDIRALLVELSSKGKIILFISEEHHEFFYIKNFFKHQKIDRPSNPKYPEFKPDNAVQYTRLVEHSTSPRSEVKLSKDKLSKDKLLSAKPDDSEEKSSFDIFWEEYPRKVQKKTAKDVWKSKHLDSRLPEIREFITKAKNTNDWQKDNGQFIPHPSTFLKQERWTDDLSAYNRARGPTVYKNANSDEFLEKLKKKVL
jgi:hypothetical protein